MSAVACGVCGCPGSPGCVVCVHVVGVGDWLGAAPAGEGELGEEFGSGSAVVCAVALPVLLFAGAAACGGGEGAAVDAGSAHHMPVITRLRFISLLP